MVVVITSITWSKSPDQVSDIIQIISISLEKESYTITEKMYKSYQWGSNIRPGPSCFELDQYGEDYKFIVKDSSRVGVNSGIGIEIASRGIGIGIGIAKWNGPELKWNCRFHFNSTNIFFYFMTVLQYQITKSECLSFVIVNPLEYNTKQCQLHFCTWYVLNKIVSAALSVHLVVTTYSQGCQVGRNVFIQ